jgi:hypothetical protein
MKLPQTGGCQCGKIRYEITEAPQLVYTCHCTDCQRLTSSAFSLGIVVAETAFRLSGIEPRPLQRTADSGRTNTRWVCPECGSWVCSPQRWRGSRAWGHAGRYVMTKTDPAYLDPQQTALGHARLRRSDFRGAAPSVKETPDDPHPVR